MRVSVQWRGSESVDRALDQLEPKARRGARLGLSAIGLIIRAEAVRLVQKGPKTGRVYVKDGGVRHRASAPGEPPASDTGNLARSITHEIDEQALEVAIGAEAEYAKDLEYGTFRVQPRPFLRPALNRTKGRFSDVLQRFIRAELRK